MTGDAGDASDPGHATGSDRPAEHSGDSGAVETNGIETYYVRSGSGPPIVLVHGAIMDHGMWAPQLDRLAGEFEVVAYDVRGHGRTGGSDRSPYAVDLYADDLHALLGALDLERPILCGLSLGGCVAQTYAARHPDALSGLVLSDPFTPDLSRPAERAQMGLLRASIPLVRLLGYPRVQRWLAWLNERVDPGSSGDYDAIERVQAEAPTMTTTEFAKVIRSILAFRRAEIAYAEIAVPTLVLYGENAPSLFARQAALLAAAIPDVTVRVVPGGGHASNMDNPDFWCDALRDFASAAGVGFESA